MESFKTQGLYPSQGPIKNRTSGRETTGRQVGRWMDGWVDRQVDIERQLDKANAGAG